jgi:hypothetical protein
MIYKPVSLTENQIGKYVDIDGDGIPEGVIFADLAIGADRLWNETPNTRYRYEKSSKKLKEYVVVGTYSHALNGKREMLTPILDGEDRFYIMALQDVTQNEHYWYKNAFYKKMPDYEKTTLNVFGSGRQNTLNMMKKWTNEEYGKQDSLDIWNVIKEQVDNGWFIPSIREWAAFAEELHINFCDEISDSYWSSSQYNDVGAYGIDVDVSDLLMGGTILTFHVRLAKTI